MRQVDRPAGLLGNFARVDSMNSADFVGRLDAMHMLEFFRTYKQETFALLGLRAGSTAADIGCGTGEDASAMHGLVGQSGSIVGFDLSDAMLAEARRRHSENETNLKFIRAQAGELGVAGETFDAVRADRVLTHVQEPAAVVREMARVLKPGGRIVISEPDMLGCWVTNRHREISDRIMREIAMSCRQPYIARDLYHCFLEAGISDVQLSLRPVAIADPEPVDNILGFRQTMDAMIQNGNLKIEEANLWFADFNDRRNRGYFLAGVTIFIVSGSKKL